MQEILTRTYCRNPRCRSKLPEPVGNPHAAFCTKGCWQQYHRARCCVCERGIKQPKHGVSVLCKRRPCRLELNKWPAVYLPFGNPSSQKGKSSSSNGHKTAPTLVRGLFHETYASRRPRDAGRPVRPTALVLDTMSSPGDGLARGQRISAIRPEKLGRPR